MSNHHQRDRRQNRTVPLLLLGGAAGYFLRETGMGLIYGNEINPLVALAYLIFISAMTGLLSDFLWFLGNHFDEKAALTPEGNKGTSAFVQSRAEIAHELIEDGWDPYWGMFQGKEIISDFAANAMVVGPAGSGKTSEIGIPLILSIRESKVITDLKPELVFVAARELRERGEEVRILNLGDVKQELLGETDYYNFLCIIADDYERPNGLYDISFDVHEIVVELKPEPDKISEATNDNSYFEIGSRGLIGFAIQLCILIKGHHATIGDVSELLDDKEEFLRHAQWACGRLEQVGAVGTTTYATMPIEGSPWNDGRHDPDILEKYIRYFRKLGTKAANLLEAKESKTAESFLTGAQQAVERFNITTRVHKNTSKTTFRFGDLKDANKITTVFILADASRLEAQKQALGLTQACMFTELKRHLNHSVPVYIIADEGTNFKIRGVDDLFTWGRGFGIRIAIIFQSLAAFRKTYGSDALATLLNETEIKIFLKGQKDAETLDMLERSFLGQQAYVADGRSGNVKSPDYRITGFDYREDGKPLMTIDKIRRTDKAILFIRNCRPILVDLPSVAAIHPFRDQIDINPFHGKPYRLPIELVIDREGTSKRGKSFWRRIKKLFARKPLENSERKSRYARLSRHAFLASTLLRFWWVALLIAFMASPVGPHMLVWYQYSQYGSHGAKSYFNCHYLGSRGVIQPSVPASCPIFIFTDSRHWRTP
ncbi:type IV secretory system conjugative DNA transfer family protein [uncultured Cohaesibacter sp.]|uniref:type IV secretory system conjugative DNA transfer family protein n=1 Tax=uncultured Cohaesibacter sp. TaxID=1002546 RepID=UPI002AA7BB35|nr:type IV secretory system conjugative DNA transfer family protein [uncultured Cohaesibacter sp.]